MDNLEEMDRFLEEFSLPRLNQEEIEIMDNSITSTDIEAVIKNLPESKTQDQMASQENSIKHLEKSLMPILLKLFQKIAEEGTLPNSFYKATITLISNQTKQHKKENYRPISLINRCKKDQQNFSKQNTLMHQKARIP